jgi:hypothetical protein
MSHFRLTCLLGLAAALLLAQPAFAVKTSRPSQLVGTAPGVVVDPILSAGDTVPEGQTPEYQMTGIPDGLGAWVKQHRGHRNHPGRHATGNFHVLMNHELGITFPGQPPGVDARISDLTINRQTLDVRSAKYLMKGTVAEGFERFCSATLQMIHGTPWYFTGEEAINAGHDGSSIAMNAKTGIWVETPHFGHIQHENVVPTKLSKWFFLTTDDDFRAGQDAYLYAYIAKTFRGAISGDQGSLYVWKADSGAQSTDIAKGETLSGRFVPLTQAENANSTTIKAAAAAKGAFKFDRLEDAALYKQKKGRYFFTDTGKAPRTERGRVYQFDVKQGDPTRASLKLLLDGDNGDDFANPDNLDTAPGKLVFQEDREAAFRNVYNRVLVYDLRTGTLTPVARVDTPATLSPGTWESSGVVNASHILGRGWWFTDVQAHSTFMSQPGPALEPDSASGEDGQLQAVYIPQTIAGKGAKSKSPARRPHRLRPG